MEKITIWGISSFLKLENKSPFSGMVVPTGMDKDLLIDTIMLNCGEYPMRLTDPYFLTEAIEYWSKSKLRAFERIWTVWNNEYNALYNYDKTEQITDTSAGSNSVTRTANYDTTRTNSSVTGTKRLEDEENIHSKLVTGDSSMHDEYKDTIHGGNVAVTDSGNDNTKVKGNLFSDNGINNTTNIHTARLYGNVGTTKTQEMAIDETNYRLGYNPYDVMTKEFIKEFVTPIYC